MQLLRLMLQNNLKLLIHFLYHMEKFHPQKYLMNDLFWVSGHFTEDILGSNLPGAQTTLHSHMSVED